MAAILAIAGIVMMTYADGFHSHSVIGIALVVGSASMSALYKVNIHKNLFGLNKADHLILLSCSQLIPNAAFANLYAVQQCMFFLWIPVISTKTSLTLERSIYLC